MAVESPYILPFEQCDAGAHRRVGGKNASLGSMIQAGAPVPPGFAVTTDTYQEMLSANGVNRQIQEYLAQISPADVEGIELISATSIRALIEQTPLLLHRTSYSPSLCRALPEMRPGRGSGRAFQRHRRRFAGSQLCRAVRPSVDCRPRGSDNGDSGPHPASTRRGPFYRIEKGFPHEKVYMSVGVQKMVNARAAGVMFTLNPINGDRSKVVIDASWGWRGGRRRRK
ncbi:MAG: PEP/pyruvate-binding domain-containing protein [Anaerolineae bacterium]